VEFKIVLTKIKANKIISNVFISIIVGCFICVNASALVLNEAGLADCYLPKKDSSSAVGSINLDFYLCEDTNFFHAIFVGDFVDQGESVSFDWVGDYWSGSVGLNYNLNADNNREVLASGTSRHLVPDLAPNWMFDDLVGGGTGEKTNETNNFTRGSVQHGSDEDRYSAIFRFNEGRGLYNFDANPQPFERGFMLEVKGRHGNGPFCIRYAPGGNGCEEFAAPDFFAVSEPSSLSLLLFGLLGLGMMRKITGLVS